MEKNSPGGGAIRFFLLFSCIVQILFILLQPEINKRGYYEYQFQNNTYPPHRV